VTDMDLVDKAKGMRMLVGKQVIIQLRDGDPWMGVCSEDGSPAPIMVKREGGAALMHSPFVEGKLVAYEPPHLLIEYLDQNKSKMLQALHQDAVVGVTCVLEQAAVHIIQPG
jgi:hypothetical protein